MKLSRTRPRLNPESQMIEPAYYHSKIATFLTANQEQILGELASGHSFALDIMQKNAWIEQISNLKQQPTDFPNHEIFLEFAIPRMGKRVDVVLLIGGVNAFWNTRSEQKP